MALDYRKIRKDKEQEYGTKVGNYGRLLAALYSDRAHFIFELLQNAEDALRERGSEWEGSKAVSFKLTKNELRFSHFGRPFNEADVRGICEIAESVKSDDLTAIGRFGIGFQSVYAVTDRPEIHSGPEDFAIENYVLPVATPTIERGVDDTVFLLPLKSNGESTYDDIVTGLIGFGASSLLFLRQIDEVEWHIEDGRSGHYLRESKSLDEGIRHVTVIGQMFGAQDVSSEWLVFSRAVTRDEGRPAGHVEIAFLLDSDKQNIQPVNDSRLIVFFPTTLETHLGFLMQGPYQTTPSRDNVPPHEPWNNHLVEETSILLLQALRWLRDRGDLSTDVLRCLPLNSQRFGATADSGFKFPSASPIHANMFAPLFTITKQALSSEPLLPCMNSGYTSAEDALLGRGEEIRQLFSGEQLSAIYGEGNEVSWLSADITQDRAPQIREYLMSELSVEEVDPERITRRLTGDFLEGQPDCWIRRLYEFLNGQRAIIRMLTGRSPRPLDLNIPLIRLIDGRHVPLGQPQAFLPGVERTDFPTVRPSVCETAEARSFLETLGIREPDLVDDVLKNVVPKYRIHGRVVNDDEYESDISRIVRAIASDSTSQRKRLVKQLRGTPFVRSVGSGSSERSYASPRDLYLPTKKLKQLFEGIDIVRFIDDGYDCLHKEEVQDLLESCGATSYLKPIRDDTALTLEEKRQIRHRDGSTREEAINNWNLLGLDALLERLPFLAGDQRSERAEMLWQFLTELVHRGRRECFLGTYEYHYYAWQSRTFPSQFVKRLNESPWIPNEDSNLSLPRSVSFTDLGWEADDFLLSQIEFMPPRSPAVANLAREYGLEPDILDLIRDKKITTERLREWLATEEVESADAAPLEDDGLSQVSLEDSFAKHFYGAQTTSPSPASDNLAVLPAGGPKTSQSAIDSTVRSDHVRRTERHELKLVARTELGPEGRALGEEFRSMVHGDYGKRCQICGSTFVTASGRWQVNVVHVVPPRTDHRTNHFGDLLGLCGWHFNLLQYGEWALLDPNTYLPFEDLNGTPGWERMRAFILDRSQDTDEMGNPFVGLPVRFYNVYKDKNAEPVAIDEQIRYSIPHWEFLRALMRI